MKKSMNSTESEAALTSMTLTAYLNKSRDVFSFYLSKLGTASPQNHSNILAV